MHSSLQAQGSQAQYQDGDGNIRYGPDKKPKIKIKPLYLELEEGDKARFKCAVLKGRPITSIYWTRGRNGKLPSHAITDDSGLLQFDYVTHEDEKDYFCHVTNDKGTTMAQARLNVRKAGKHAKKRQSKFLINKIDKVDKGEINKWTNPNDKHVKDRHPNYANLKSNKVDKAEINNHASTAGKKRVSKGEINPVGTSHVFPNLANPNVYGDNYVYDYKYTEDVPGKTPDPDTHASPAESYAVVSKMSDESYFRYLTGYRTPSIIKSPEKSPTPPPPEEPTPRISSKAPSRHTEPPSHHTEPPKKEKKVVSRPKPRRRVQPQPSPPPPAPVIVDDDQSFFHPYLTLGVLMYALCLLVIYLSVGCPG